MPAPTTSTIGSGGTYSTLAAWLADMPADITTGGSAGNYVANLKLQNFSSASTLLTLDGITTDASHTIAIGCDTTTSWRDNAGVLTNALLPNASNGAILTCTGAYTTALVCHIPFVTFFGLQVDSTGSSSRAFLHSVAAGTGNTIDSCLFRSLSHGSDHVVTIGEYVVKNCLVVAAGDSGDGIVFASATSTLVEDCTVVRTANQTAAGNGITIPYGSHVLRGNAVFNFATAVSGTLASGSGHNCTDLSSLGAGAGASTGDTTSLTYANCFQNTGSTPANADFRAKSGSPLIAAGLVISGITVDAAGTARSGSAPTAGAWEFVASDTTAPVVASSNVNAAGTTLTIAFTEAGSPPVLPASGVTGLTISPSGGAATLSSIAISGLTLTATISRTILSTETVTRSYTPGNITDSAGTPNALASFSGVSVTNNSTQSASLAAGTVSFVSTGTAGIVLSGSDATGGTPSYTYQWQRKTGSGGTYSNLSNGSGVSGATTRSLTDGSATIGNDYFYRLNYTDSAGSPATVSSGGFEAGIYLGGPLSGGGSIVKSGQRRRGR